MATPARFIRWLEELSLGDVALVGGKTASLGELFRELTPLGIRVPNGYTVTTDAAVAIARRLLESGPPPGFTTPARLMGAEFVTTLPGAGRIALE